MSEAKLTPDPAYVAAMKAIKRGLACPDQHLHAVRDPKDVQKWCLVTSDEADAVTINARIIAEGLNEANARFIVAACNAHADLVSALKECVTELEAVWAGGGMVNQNRHAVAARAALAKCETPRASEDSARSAPSPDEGTST